MCRTSIAAHCSRSKRGLYYRGALHGSVAATLSHVTLQWATKMPERLNQSRTLMIQALTCPKVWAATHNARGDASLFILSRLLIILVPAEPQKMKDIAFNKYCLSLLSRAFVSNEHSYLKKNPWKINIKINLHDA